MSSRSFLVIHHYDNLWIPVDEPTTTGRPAGWSLDGSVLYLLLDADGFRCL